MYYLLREVGDFCDAFVTLSKLNRVFRIWGSGFRVQGSLDLCVCFAPMSFQGYDMPALGLRVQGVVFRI